MELLREKLQTQIAETEEAQQHNAMIRERYRKLQNAEADQFAEETHTEEKAYENVIAPETPSLYISPSSVNTSTLEQTPRVTEYSPLFTTEKFERMQEAEVIAPTAAIAPTQSVSLVSEAQYALSSFAKVVMAVFTLVVVAMLTLICVNTQLINQKRVRIQNLEEKKEQLMEQYDELQARIEAATSEETILDYAQSQGW